MIAGIVLAVAIVVAGGLFGRRARQLYRIIRLGKPVPRFDDVPERIRNEVVIVAGQRKLLQRLVPGLVHAFIFWGFVVLLPTILMALIGIVSKTTTIPWLGHQGWFALLVDVFATMVLVGVVAAFAIRKIQKPRRFEGSHLREADLILLLIAGIVTTLIGWHASRIALGLNEYPAEWSPVSNAVSNLFGGGDGTEVAERVLVWAHVTIILGFMVYLPYSKHLHIATAGFNVYFGRTRARGRLEPLDFSEGQPEEAMRFGVGTIADMTWKQMLDTVSCTECGRCQDVCPAFATGKALSPKLLIMGLRDQLFAEGTKPARGGSWRHGVHHHAARPEGRHRRRRLGLRHLRRLRLRVPGVDRARRPHRRPAPRARDGRLAVPGRGGHDAARRRAVREPVGQAADRARRLGRGPRRARARAGRGAARGAVLGRLRAGLRRAGPGGRPVDRQADAGRGRRLRDPRPARVLHGRPGAADGRRVHVPVLRAAERRDAERADVTKIVTTCPHCYNSLGNEYPDFGGRYEVVHHTELLAELVRDGRLTPAADERTITYHDSCYLARHNDVAAEPRELVAAVGQPIEMEKHGKRTFCCGAGGAHMWMEERGSQINEERVRQATETGASTLAVACPFCTVMLDDGVRSAGADIEVVDVATLLVQAVERGGAKPVT